MSCFEAPPFEQSYGPSLPGPQGPAGPQGPQGPAGPAAPELYARPEEWGGGWGGDDTAAIQSAVNDGRPVLLTGAYNVSATIQVANPRQVYCTTGSVTTTMNAPIFRVTSESRFVNVLTIGDGPGAFEDQGKVNQSGIFVDGGRGTVLDNCYGYNLGGSATLIENTASVLWGVQIIAPRAEQCNNAVRVRNVGEYAAVTNSQFHRCWRGAYIEAGNFNWTGGKCLEGRSSVWIAPGANDAHGLVADVLLNHQGAHTLHVDGPINNGFRIARCTFYGGAFVLTGNCVGISIEDCTISGAEFYLSGMGSAGRLILTNTRWNATNTVVTPAPLPANIVSTGGTDLLTGLPRADV